MLSPQELRTLDAALQRIVPLSEAVRRFVLQRAEERSDLYRAGLALLDGRRFAERTASEQDAVLTEFEGHPSIVLIVQHAVEGYYTSPEGMADVGFRVTA